MTHVAKGFEETTFILTKEEWSELTEDQKEVYILMHRWFNHLGPDKLCNLHKVTTLSHPIKVPAKQNICEVCTITKMTNLIPKLISKHKAFLLTLIKFNITRLFLISLYRNKYFLLIINN